MHAPGPGDVSAAVTTRGAAVVAGWVLLLLAVTAAMATLGDAPATTVRYAVVWALSTTLPGVLVWRALSTRPTAVQEVGFGSVLGIGLLLLAWMPATLVHRPALIWLEPLGVGAAFALVPGLRRHWRPHRPAGFRTPGRWHGAMIVTCAVAFLRSYETRLRVQALPPAPSRIFQDVWYEVSLTERVTQGLPLDDPAAQGVPLDYHWFSNAHASATATLSGVPAVQVVLHLWIVAMLLTFVLVTAAAAQRLVQGRRGGSATGRWWAGPLAAFLAAAVPVALVLGPVGVSGIDNGFVVSSTSGILALTVVLCLVGPVLDLLYGDRSRGTWVLVVLLLVLSSGTKPSILPVVACGCLVVAVAEGVRTRRPPWVPVALMLVSVGLVPVAATVVMGSTSGSRLQLLDTLTLDPAFRRAAGTAIGLPGHGGWLTPGLADGPGGVWPVAGGVLVLYVLTELPRLLGLLGPAARGLRGDPGVLWCAGVVGSGFCGLWVLAHPGYSQHYFWRIVIGLGVVLAVTDVVRLLPEHVRARELLPHVALVGGAGLATGVAILLLDRSTSDAVTTRFAPYAVATVVLGALVLLRRDRPRHRWRPARLSVLGTVTCFCFTVGVAGSLAPDVTATLALASPVGTVESGPAERSVSTDEARGARWLADHSAASDVVATNVLCAPVVYARHCNHVAFWVSALTSRQLFIGSWAYTQRSLAAYAHGSVPFSRRDSPWPGRVALSLAAVQAPTPGRISRLRARGVRWIYADAGATAVSSRLRRLASLRFSAGDVQVFRLPEHPR